MNLKLDFLKIKKQKKFKKKSIEIDVNFYWKILLYVSLLIIIASFVYGILLFLKTNKDFKLPEAQTSSQLEKVKKDRINKILDYFSQKEKKSQDILELPSGVIDPSK
jgi:hypothetical protein